MTTYVYRLTRIDQNFITPRTGKNSVVCVSNSKIKLGQNIFIYDKAENCESPGVQMYIANLENIGNEFHFFDGDNAAYKAEFIKENKQQD